jgi:N-acetylmuramoyl-L-alanine amidase
MSILNIDEQLLTPNEFSRPGKALEALRGVVIHYTGNPGASAQGNRDYFESLGGSTNTGKVYASAHYIVGLEGEIIRCVPDNEMAYHVGAKSYKLPALLRLSPYPNNCTIGIELCIDKGGAFTEGEMASCRALCRELLDEYHLSDGGVRPAALWRHYDITGKDCPRPFVKDPEAWNLFRESVGRLWRGEELWRLMRESPQIYF